MPGSTNFQQWNPSVANQENDAAYTADSLRSGGAPTAAILPSQTFNKLAYQLSTFVSAFAQMMANKGYGVSDANFSSLVAALANVKTSSEFLSAITIVPYATSVTFNAGTSAQFDLTLTGDVASSSLINATDGQLLAFIISQDGSGGHSFAWPTNVVSPGTICPFANSTSIQFFVVRPASNAAGKIVPLTQMIWVTAAGIRLSAGPTVVSINSNGTVSSAYQEIVEKVDASGGMVTRTLFTAAGFAGFKVNGKKVDATQNAVRYAAVGGQTIDGQPNIDLIRQWDSLTFISDGANWSII